MPNISVSNSSSRSKRVGNGSTTAVLHVRTGEEMAIQSIVTIEDAYLVVKVFPFDVNSASRKRRKAARDAQRKMPDGAVFYDQFAFGYEEIMLVRLTIIQTRSI